MGKISFMNVRKIDSIGDCSEQLDAESSSLYLLIVNYYSVTLISNLLTSGDLGEHRPTVVVVNNSRDDKEIILLTKIYPSLILIEAGRNLGFGGGCNIGLKWIYQQNLNALVWLINPDTTLDRNAIFYIRSCFERHPNLAILGTSIRNSLGAIWFRSGAFNPWTGSVTHLNAFPKKFILENHPWQSAQSNLLIAPSRWVSGCSLIIHMAHFDDCPVFDENMFLYYEDSEFCERYGRLGKNIAVTQKSLVTHIVSGTTSRDKKAQLNHATFSKLYFLKKHGTLLSLYLNLIYFSTQIFWGQLTSNTNFAVGRWQGVRSFLKFNMTH
ncbi:MAG TPA: glycosyltransferase family 2 protein [Trichocoleus sp.]